MAAPEYQLLSNNDSAVALSGRWYQYNSSPGNYLGPRYLLSYATNASLSVTFSGTCIWYYSDRNADHGAYTIAIDGGAPVQQSSYSDSMQDISLLYASQALDAGQHVLTLTDVEEKGLGAAYFLYRPLGLPTPTDCPTPSSTPAALDADAPTDQDVIINAAHPSLSYTPADKWVSLGDYRLSYTKGASVEFHFSGSKIWMESDRNWDHGDFEITIDDGPATRIAAFSPIHESEVMLYASSGLQSGQQHVVKITNLDDGKGLGIGNFILRGSEPSTNDELASSRAPHETSGPDSSSGSQPDASGGLPAGVYVGITLGCIAFVLLVILVFFIVRQRRRDRSASVYPLPPPIVVSTSGDARSSNPFADQHYWRPPASSPETLLAPQQFVSESSLSVPVSQSRDAAQHH